MSKQSVPIGVMSIDKPAGLTSHDVVDKVRLFLGIKKIGHAGTLDPFATGVLVVAVGAATRLLQFTSTWHKTYRAEITLGSNSATDDLTGDIATVSNVKPSLADVKKVARSFVGKINQIPPIYSAKKMAGDKLYELARSGRRTEAIAAAGERRKIVSIYSIEIEKYQYPSLTLLIECGSGTYIRAIARDIGVMLDVGAYCAALRRLSVGPFDISESVSLDEISTDNALSLVHLPENLINHLPFTNFPSLSVAKLKNGLTVAVQENLNDDDNVALFTENNILFGVGKYNSFNDRISPTVILPTGDM
jgi:tRNA pseudouridine55 synthase